MCGSKKQLPSIMIIMHLVQLWSVIKSLWPAAFLFGLKSFCLAKTLVSLRATDQMWREIIFFTELDKLRFLHGFLRIIWFYHLPGKYPEADPQDDRVMATSPCPDARCWPRYHVRTLAHTKGCRQCSPTPSPPIVTGSQSLRLGDRRNTTNPMNGTEKNKKNT